MEIDFEHIKVIGFDADDTLWVNETYFREAEERVGILLSHFETPNKIEVYPNPAQSNLNITSDKPIEQISIYNIAGELVMVEQAFENVQSIDISKLAGGIYIVKAIQDGSTLVNQFIKN